MTSWTCLRLNVTISSHLRSQLHPGSRTQNPRFLHIKRIPCPLSLWNLHSTKYFARESSLLVSSTKNYDDIIKGNDVVEPIHAEEGPEIQVLQSDQHLVDVETKSAVPQQSFSLPMWLLGPSVLLVTSIVPTLWLPLSSAFVGPSIAGVLSLIGLDCIFNMGAMLFLLMADTCGRPLILSSGSAHQISALYKFWNLGASIFGFIIPLALLFASSKGYLQPQMQFVPIAVLLGPYVLLLSTQMLTEVLTWHWRSPVWLVAPVVYEAYRVLQLMRGLTLAPEVGAAAWMVESLRYMVTWWVLVLGIQLMQIAKFAGLISRVESAADQLS